MFRCYKRLALAVVAALAVSGLMASAATAVPQYTASSYPATFTGSNPVGAETTTTEAGTSQCASHFVSGSISGPTSTLTITPTYTNCTWFGFQNVTVNTEGCTYVLHATEKVATDVYRHHMDVACPEGKSMKFAVATCKWEIKPQTNLTTVATTNSGGTVTLQWNVTNMTINVTQDGFGCPFSGTGAKTAGYHGDVVFSRVGGGSFSVSGS